MPSTSYAARQPPQEEGERPVTVLVTGFGPFLDKYPLNTSWAIAFRLPALLPATPTHPTPIHIHVHPSPIRVAYNAVTSLIPAILPSPDLKSPQNQYHPPPSIILHIGLAAGRTYYTLERGAHARGYGAIPDVDGVRFRDEEAEKLWPLDRFPSVIETSFDTGDVGARWADNLTPKNEDHGDDMNEKSLTKGVPQHDVRISPDGGNFMCGFIYWNSLAHYYSQEKDARKGPLDQGDHHRQQQQQPMQDQPGSGNAAESEAKAPEKPVAFLHVPDLSSSPEKIAGGVDVAIALIRALVESKREVGFVEDAVKTAGGMGDVGDARAQTDNNFA